MRRLWKWVVVAWFCSGSWTLALEIHLDYSLDTNDFFKIEGSPQRVAMRAVADYFETLITDDLSEINAEAYGGETNQWDISLTHPGTGENLVMEGPNVPASTIIVFVGGRTFDGNFLGFGGPGTSFPRGDQAWVDLVQSRGETNPDGSLAIGPEARDYGPWGGDIVFDINRRWNFSLTRRLPDGRLGEDFVSVALHEMCHVLGIGTSDSWSNAIEVNDDGVPLFTGKHSVAEFGKPVPMEPEALQHWQNPMFCVPGRNFNPHNPLNVLSKTINHFGDPGDRDQIALMNPSICSAAGVLFRVMTRLDVAALRDVGWTVDGEMAPPMNVGDLRLETRSKTVELEWPSQVGRFYEVEWSRGLRADWQPLAEPMRGDGKSLRLVDRSSDDQRFYRLVVEQR